MRSSTATNFSNEATKIQEVYDKLRSILKIVINLKIVGRVADPAILLQRQVSEPLYNFRKLRIRVLLGF